MRLRRLIPIGCIVAVLVVVGLALWDLRPIEDVAEGVANDGRFPEGANDINYNISTVAWFGWENSSFNISEDDFIAHAREREWDLQPIEEPTEFSLGLDPGGDLKIEEISDGLVYRTPVADNGGFFLAVYDRSAGRATIKMSKN